MKKFIIGALLLTCILLVGCSSNTFDVEESKDSTINEVVNKNENADNANKTIEPEKLFTEESLKTIGNISIDTKKSKDFNSDTEDKDLINRGIQYEGQEEPWNGLNFYLFDDYTKTNKAFEYIKTNLLVPNTFTETENTLYGQDKEANGIVIKKFYYKVGNMIIESTDFIGDPGILDATESDFKKEEIEKRHKEITDFWTISKIK